MFSWFSFEILLVFIQMEPKSFYQEITQYGNFTLLIMFT